eukprot:g5317.t1
MSQSSTPLFPSGAGASCGDQQPPQSFASFQPPVQNQSRHLEELLSSSDEESFVGRKRRNQSSPSEISKKRKQQSIEEQGCIFDRKGDELNVSFGSLYRLDIVPYRPQRLTSNYVKNANSGIGTERYFSQKHVLQQRSKKFKRLRFLRVIPRLNPVQEESYLPLDLDEEDSVLLESLHEELLRKTRDFNIQLRTSPHDLELWKKFASFQDEIIQQTRRRISVIALAEKKLSILSGALIHHPKNEELLSMLIKLTAQVVAPVEAQEKFENLLLRLPSSLVIWTTYVDYLKSTFGEFYCEKLRGVYQGCMKGIEEGMKQNSCLMIDSSRSEEDLILAFLLSIQFDLQSGFDEKAIAKIQSCLEWNFCSPANKRTFSEESLHDFFRRYWEDDSISKIGESSTPFCFNEFVDQQIIQPASSVVNMANPEPRAEPWDQEVSNGWSGWFDAGQEPVQEPKAPEEDNKEDEEELSEQEEEEEELHETEQELLNELGMKLESLEEPNRINSATLERFFETEESRSHQGVLPSHTASSSATDLDHIVLFEELQLLFFEVQKTSSKKKLLLGVFTVLGLDISELVSSNDAFFIRLESEMESTPVWLSRGIKDLAPRVDRLSPWFLQDAFKGKLVIDLLEFFSVELFPGDLRIRKLWLETAWAVEESTQSSPSLTALGKSILRRYKTDLNLWSAYGAVLVEEEGIAKGRKVWLGVVQSLARGSSDPSLCIASIIKEALQAIKVDRNSLHLLAYLATTNVRHLSAFMKQDVEWSMEIEVLCREYFQNQIESIVDLTWEDYDTVICAGYFQGITASIKGNIGGVDKIYSHARHWLRNQLSRFIDRDSSRQVEALHEIYCSWCARAGLRPRELRTEILSSLKLFPNSKKLLIQFTKVQVASHAISSLLRDLKSHVFKKPTIGSIALILHLEGLRSLQDFNLPNLFERVLKIQDGSLSISPLIWRMFIYAMCQHGDLIKRTFLRAIRACPWSKLIWLEGLRACSQAAMKPNEVNEFLETMKEKGIRLRTDIYEILLEDVVI